MKNFISIITLSVNNIVEKNRSLYQKRLELVTRAYKEANEEMMPNIDNRGRLHAPCNGYKIPDRTLNTFDFTDCYDEKLFRKGEFLPNPITDELFSFFSGSVNKSSFKVGFRLEGDEMIDTFKTLKEDSKGMPYDITFSREWTFKGERCCFVNISSIWKSVCQLFDDEMKKIIDKKEAAIQAAKKKEQEEKKANKGVAPTGRVHVKGVVTGFKGHETYFGTTWKMLVTLENGATVFGSIPSSIIEVQKGDNVFFTATFENDKNDNTHSFFKRPSKADYESNQPA